MTTQSLKHTAFKIWTAAAVAVPLTLWLLSRLNPSGGAGAPIAILGLLLAVTYAGSGWLASQAAQRLIPTLLHEAGLWERSGDIDRAEKIYQKILALYDSFLVSPKARRRGIPPLVSRMARMYAAQADKQEDAARFMERYLSRYPADRDIADTWLQTRVYQGALTPRQQELAARISEAHRDDAVLQTSLARLFLQAKRTDFPALQTYRRALRASRAGASRLPLDLSQLFIAEGRSDEWALPVYLQAARREPPPQDLRCGLAACLRWIPPSERNAEWLIEARRLLDDPSEETLVRMSSGFVPPSGSYPVRDLAQKPLGEAARRPGGHFLQTVHNAARRLLHTGAGALRQSPRLRRSMGWGLTAILGVMAVVFIVNTVGHLAPTPTPARPPQPITPAPEPAVAPPPPLPYTLQVAAYLKPEHAEHYLRELKAQDLDAYLTQAHGNDKTWYQVRIAHFPSKAAALSYGSDLKSRGLIEDFYVAKDPQP
jgi:hypothetical protein